MFEQLIHFLSSFTTFLFLLIILLSTVFIFISDIIIKNERNRKIWTTLFVFLAALCTYLLGVSDSNQKDRTENNTKDLKKTATTIKDTTSLNLQLSKQIKSLGILNNLLDSQIEKISNENTELTKKANRLIDSVGLITSNLITGGNSFPVCRFKIKMDEVPHRTVIDIQNEGKYPLYELVVSLMDVDIAIHPEFPRADIRENMSHKEREDKWHEEDRERDSIMNQERYNEVQIPVQNVIGAGKIVEIYSPTEIKGNGKERNFRITYLSRNYQFLQLIRIRTDEESYSFAGFNMATRIIRLSDKKIMLEYTDKDFWKKGEKKEINWDYFYYTHHDFKTGKDIPIK